MSIQTAKAHYNDTFDASGLSNGTYVEYIDASGFVQSDFEIIQDGGSTGTISFTIHASRTPSRNESKNRVLIENYRYEDVGLEFYHLTEFSDASVNFIDNDNKTKSISAFKIVFTVSGVTASDASYEVTHIGILTNAS